MEKNYYDKVIDRVKKLIKTQKYNVALELLSIELNQVYLPHEYEDAFHDLYNEAESYILDDEEYIEVLSEKELVTMLNGSPEQQFAAINNLDNLNLRNYIEVIQDYFLTDSFPQLKGRLLDLCSVQKIDHVFIFKGSDGIVEVNPILQESVDDMEFINLAFDYFNNHLYKNPSLIQIAQIALVEKVYSIFPKVFLVDNLEEICESVISEINEMFDVEAIARFNDYYH